ncbi:MAG: beta-ketoacyl synthase chain length factor [Dyadobacter sp.]|uniref:beta-ketoacyl synthase chain length factor n=1 Tax=Dyadobacter sp. TaxID=1914288 RepID=UPI0032649964
MFYISAASSISHQPTFKNAGFSAFIGPLTESSALVSPDYKGFIEAGLLRRMSKILRMSVACSKDCIEQAGIEQPNAIVVGTGLGCLQDTEKFLNNSITIEGLLPPTAFIQSTHNTMAGQISLSIGNHGYNMTHTQNTLSFEHALQDAMLLLNEGEKHILVGAADEYIEILTEISGQLNIRPETLLASGASFFVLSKEKTTASLAVVKDCVTTGLVQDIPEKIASFLSDNGLKASDLDLILYSGASNGLNHDDVFLKTLPASLGKCVDYLQLSGIYPTASAFALHYAADLMNQNKSLKNILIYNSLIQRNLGLTLVQSIEA